MNTARGAVVDETALAEIQAAHTPMTPLVSMSTGEQDQVRVHQGEYRLEHLRRRGDLAGARSTLQTLAPAAASTAAANRIDRTGDRRIALPST